MLARFSLQDFQIIPGGFFFVSPVGNLLLSLISENFKNLKFFPVCQAVSTGVPYRLRYFHHTTPFETGLRDCHKLILTLAMAYFNKLDPKILNMGIKKRL